jgi:hypothetical protein
VVTQQVTSRIVLSSKEIVGYNESTHFTFLDKEKPFQTILLHVFMLTMNLLLPNVFSLPRNSVV